MEKENSKKSDETKKKILVVEKNPVRRGDLIALLTINNYLPHGVDGLGSAVEIIKEWIPDLAIIDLHSKNRLEGVRLVEYFKSKRCLRKIPIIILMGEARYYFKKKYPIIYRPLKDKEVLENARKLLKE